MSPFVQSFEFRGTARKLADGTLVLNGVADTDDGSEALLEARLALLGRRQFDEEGSISFGGFDTVKFRSLQPGELAPSADDELEQGAVVLAVEGGGGAFARASGRIVSNFLLSTTGELTDRSLAVVFGAAAGPAPGRSPGRSDK